MMIYWYNLHNGLLCTSGAFGFWNSPVVEPCCWKHMAHMYGTDCLSEDFAPHHTMVLREVQTLDCCMTRPVHLFIFDIKQFEFWPFAWKVCSNFNLWIMKWIFILSITHWPRNLYSFPPFLVPFLCFGYFNVSDINLLISLLVWSDIDDYINIYLQKEAVVQHLYLGRNPPLFTEMRVLRQNNDDHLVCNIWMQHSSTMSCSAFVAENFILFN